MKKLLLTMLAGMLLLCGCTPKKEEPVKNTPCDALKPDCEEKGEKADMSEFEGFADQDHVFMQISLEEALTMIQDPSLSEVIYFGFPSCPWCIDAIPILNETAKELSMKVYYVNIRAEENKVEELRNQLFSLTEPWQQTGDDGKKAFYVPAVLAVKQGVILDMHVSTVETHDAHERKISEEEAKDLKKIYETLLNSISE